ncbi:MAG: HEAT repeat domain-containing protein [Gemmataceae bacterium]
MLWWTLWGLKSRNPQRRNQTLLKLRQSPYLKEARVIRAIMAAVSDPDVEVRHHAVEILRLQLNTSQVVPALVQALADDSDRVRSEAAHALATIRDPRGAQPLVEALRHDDSRHAVARALELLGAEPIPHLIAALKSPNCTFRPEILKLFGRIKDDRALPALAWACRQPDLATQAVDALSHFGKAAAPLLIDLLKSGPQALRPELARQLGLLGEPQAIPALLASLRGSDTVTVFILLEALDRLGHLFTNLEPLRPVLPVLQAALADPQPHVRLRAIPVVSRTLGPRAIPTLVRLQADPDANVQVAVVNALAQLGDPRAIEPLLRRLIQDGPTSSLVNRLQELARVAHPAGRSQELLDELLRLEQQPQGACKQLYEAIEYLDLPRQPTVVVPLRRWLLRVFSQGRWPTTLVRLLAQVGGTEVIRPLVECFAHDWHHNDVDRLKEYLAQVDRHWPQTPEAQAALPTLLDSLRRHYAKPTAQGLDLLGWRPTTDSDRLARAIALEDKATVLALGRTAVPALIDALDKVLWFPVVEVLDQLDPAWPRSDRAKNQVPALLARLTTPGRDESHRKNWIGEAGHRLCRLQDERAVLPLLDALQQMDHPNASWDPVYLKNSLVKMGTVVVLPLLAWLDTHSVQRDGQIHALLCELNDPRLVGRLVESVAAKHGFSWKALQGLEAILTNHPAAVPLPALRQVVALADSSETRTRSVTRHEFDAMTDDPHGLARQEIERYDYSLDCGAVRRLAQAEIARRAQKR